MKPLSSGYYQIEGVVEVGTVYDQFRLGLISANTRNYVYGHQMYAGGYVVKVVSGNATGSRHTEPFMEHEGQIYLVENGQFKPCVMRRVETLGAWAYRNIFVQMMWEYPIGHEISILTELSGKLKFKLTEVGEGRMWVNGLVGSQGMTTIDERGWMSCDLGMIGLIGASRYIFREDGNWCISE